MASVEVTVRVQCASAAEVADAITVGNAVTLGGVNASVTSNDVTMLVIYTFTISTYDIHAAAQ